MAWLPWGVRVLQGTLENASAARGTMSAYGSGVTRGGQWPFFFFLAFLCGVAFFGGVPSET
jgi:hypothetical protein